MRRDRGDGVGLRIGSREIGDRMALSMVLILVGLGVALVVGLLLLAVGLRGRLVDSRPYCRKCGFCVEGLAGTGDKGAVCPECGRSLGGAKAVRMGRRRKRSVLAGIGVLLLLVALGGGGALGWTAARGFNWNTIKPAWLLEMDAGSANRGTSAGVWGELDARLGTDGLSEERSRRLVELALELQADTNHPWSTEIGDFVVTGRDQGLVTDEQWAQFYRNGMSVGAMLRPVVRAGQLVPYRFSAGGGRVGSRGQMLLAVSGVTLRTPGGRIVAERDSGAILGLGHGGSGSIVHLLDAALPEGEHELVLEVRGVLATDYTVTPENTIAEIAHAFPVSVRVVGADEPTVRIVPADEVEGVADRIEAQLVRLGRRADGRVAGTMQIAGKSLPVSCAFEGFVLIGEEEVPFGRLALPASGGTHLSHVTLELPAFEGDTLTLILRPAPQAAENTVDMEEIYGGEVILRDVEIMWRERD